MLTVTFTNSDNLFVFLKSPAILGVMSHVLKYYNFTHAEHLTLLLLIN